MKLDRFYKTFGLEEISSATDNFSDKNLIMEEGAIGKLYIIRKLRYGNLTNFVLQRFDSKYEFETEISLLKSLDHKNIVSIYGHCNENNEKNIIYGHAIRGTLNQHISEHSILTWSRRLGICLGVARGLNYIHYDVIHCDINISKIFLDKDWEPKIYGFELSTKYPQGWKHRIRYFRTKKVTENVTPKHDVYHFGLLMRQLLLCERKPTMELEADLDVENISDPSLRKQMDTESLRQFKNLADNCLHKQPVKRPTMDDIVKKLEEVLELQREHENMLQKKAHPIAAGEGTSSNTLKTDFWKIPLREILRATNYFSKNCFIGSGAYGDVYRAELDVLDIQSLSSMEGKCTKTLQKIRKEVAIKKIMYRADEQGKKGYLAEIELLSSCKHPNIVSLLGFCCENDVSVLVYEYASKGSLAEYLKSEDKTFNLTWTQRLQICLDTANGINYLHTNKEGKRRIIHRDIKSDNILLDENLNAKVADFGLSKFHPCMQHASTVCTRNIVGTNFYMDPEYESTGNYKRETDVYSFGVVLFEVLSGRLAYDYRSENENGLAPIARRRFNERTIQELIDPKLVEEDDDAHTFTINRGPNQDSFKTFSKIAYQCLAETQAKRPTMEVVIEELNKALYLQGETVVLSRFRHSDIELATNKFAETHCIGVSTKGKVYKAELNHFDNNSSSTMDSKITSDSTKKHINAVIKRITSSKGKQDFLAEIEMGTSYKHPNRVSLIGFCDEGGEMILVYEHVSEISLDDYLKSVNNMDGFTWVNRLHMCLEIAHGLNHLHTKMINPKRTIYSDIKSANILLDKNKKVKIAYFGISKLQPTNQDGGMKVYEDPKSETTSELSRELDIYSFGIVIFEIICGRVAYDPVYIKENENGLAPIACQCIVDGTIHRQIDPSLKEDTCENLFTSSRGPDNDSLDTVLKVAYQCLGETAKRPTMKMVITELKRALHIHETLLKKLQISCKEIELGTENFSDKNCVGNSRFWKAYKGDLPFQQDNANANATGRTTIVAKRWDKKLGQADHQFKTELNILCKIKHENVIGLVGYCIPMDEKIIIYEHMSNGSLDKVLKDVNLSWTKRLQICIDVARGLEFLHQGDATLKKVVHKDIKSASILLNDYWKAKISNLELSSLDSLHQDMEHVDDNAYATFGYLDPQYKQDFLTEKSDIYSFGVVLFEILCGRLAWAEDCKNHSQSLGPLAKGCYEEEKLGEIVFEGIKEQIDPISLKTFAKIAYQCLHDQKEERPTAREVVIQLKEALDDQKVFEIWEARLPNDYKEIFQMSKTPEIYSTAKRKDLHHILTKGILLIQECKWFSIGSNGERNEMVSASRFSYGNHWSHRWHALPESRFDKIAEMLDFLNLKIQIKITSPSLSAGVNYGVHLVFKFQGARKSAGDKLMYVNLTYKMGNETLHAYFATWREDDWMSIELFRFSNHNGVDFEFQLESFSRSYHGNRVVYVEGIEFRAIDNKPEENNSMEVQQPALNMNMVETNYNILSDICSIFTQPLSKPFSWRDKKKQYHMISANDVFCDTFNTSLYNLKFTITKSIFQNVAEVLSTQVFRTRCKIKSKILLRDTEYSCYLLFKLRENSCDLHYPVRVHDLHQSTDKHTEVIYFRSPKPWNKHDFNDPQERENGWMEVFVWKFKSNQEKLQNNFIPVNLEFATCEGTMLGLTVLGLEFRPM